VRRIMRTPGALGAVILAGAVAVGCAKTDENVADTAAVMPTADTAFPTPAASAPVTQDTATTATGSKTTPKKGAAPRTMTKKTTPTTGY
jgi:hypothetical protein